MGSEPTREILWGLPLWAKVAWYALVVISIGVFLWGAARPFLRYRRAEAAEWPSVRELPGRLRTALKIVFTHASIKRRDRFAGAAHSLVFYGFLVLFAGTVVLAINSDFTEPVFGWRFFEGDFYLGYSIVLDVVGVALIVGLLALIVRRAWIRPWKLDYRRPDRSPDEPQFDRRVYRAGDWIFLGGLLYLAVTGYLLEGVRIAVDNPGVDEYEPVGWAASHLFVPLGTGGLEVVRYLLWTSHGVVALAVVSAIPYTKATHMLTSFASLVFRDPRAGKRLRPIETEADDGSLPAAGYATLADFDRRHLLQVDACTKCGRCHEACPATASGLPLSPRDVVLEVHEQAVAGGVGSGSLVAALLAKPSATSPRFDAPLVSADAVKPETIWSCMQCNACVEACPVGIEQAPIINQLRRREVEEGEIPNDLLQTLRGLTKSGNSFGENRKKRGRWTRDLEFEITDARAEPVDVLWFVGDYASFDPRSQAVSRTLARLYEAAGLSFGILFDGERNAGNDVRRVGEEGLWESLAEENIETLRECTFNRIVTSDPHTLNTLRNEYPDKGGSWPVLHHTSLLLELLESGALPLAQELSCSVTYHDPCYLGRHNGEYEGPRRILEGIGCRLVEMPRNRDNSFCCGAGGGRIWMSEPAGRERPSEQRIREALELGDLDYFVVTCPKDVTMYEDAIKTTSSSDQIALRELTELVAEAAGISAG